ncbi:2-oxoadipate dioxygenase/decarboxylase family protein [Streptomyces spiralis]|uniref:2-oxoadipate dioxygenase/decarboxylase family protein n=1 Tax=Streptomyces spiralis TaxID=66376 RepID=UPI0036919F80
MDRTRPRLLHLQDQHEPAHSTRPPHTLLELLTSGWLTPEPIVYEDFLPRSAAGIFASNLTSQSSARPGDDGAPRDREWMEQAIGRPIHDPATLYAAQRKTSLVRAARDLGLPEVELPD